MELMEEQQESEELQKQVLRFVRVESLGRLVVTKEREVVVGPEYSGLVVFIFTLCFLGWIEEGSLLCLYWFVGTLISESWVFKDLLFIYLSIYLFIYMYVCIYVFMLFIWYNNI